MDATSEKVSNRYRVPLLLEETVRLTRLAADPVVRQVTVLPSFKLKPETLKLGGRNVQVTRCDDTVVVASGLHPRLCSYEVGCGTVSVALDLKRGDVRRDALVDACRTFLRPAVVTGPGTRRYDHSYSIRPDEWAETVVGGVEQFLRSRGDPHAWADSPVWRRPADETGDPAGALDHVAADWLAGHRHHTHDGSPLRFTGSHYLDLLSVVGADAGQGAVADAPEPGTLVLAVHAHGTGFGPVLAEPLLHRLLDDPDPVDAESAAMLLDAVALMNNQASLHRVALALRFVDALAAVLGPVRSRPLTEQPHYTVIRRDDQFVYYCDAQQVLGGRPALLPSGDPSTDSHLVLPGAETDGVDVGLSHNLRHALRRGPRQDEPADGDTLLVEAEPPARRFLSRRLPPRPRARVATAPGRRSARMQALVATLAADTGASATVPLRPLLRLHSVRPGERPFASSAMGGA